MRAGVPIVSPVLGAFADCFPLPLGRQSADATQLFSCPYCQSVFSHKGRLNRHIRYHMGLKSHACPCCDAKFVERFQAGDLSAVGRLSQDQVGGDAAALGLGRGQHGLERAGGAG